MAAGFQGAAAWLPLVGLVVGGLAGLVLCLAATVLPPLLCGVLGCLAWVLVTGGLHLDGVADCGDGLWVEATPERRLEIMRDSRLGTFGGAALFFILALKAAALAALTEGGSFPRILVACACAGLLARSVVFILMRQPSARPGGLGEALRQSLEPAQECWGALAALIACFCAVSVGLHGFVALIVAAAWVFWLGRVARKRLGGVTGDVFGCAVESVECLALLVLGAGL